MKLFPIKDRVENSDQTGTPVFEQSDRFWSVVAMPVLHLFNLHSGLGIDWEAAVQRN